MFARIFGQTAPDNRSSVDSQFQSISREDSFHSTVDLLTCSTGIQTETTPSNNQPGNESTSHPTHDHCEHCGFPLPPKLDTYSSICGCRESVTAATTTAETVSFQQNYGSLSLQGSSHRGQSGAQVSNDQGQLSSQNMRHSTQTSQSRIARIWNTIKRRFGSCHMSSHPQTPTEDRNQRRKSILKYITIIVIGLIATGMILYTIIVPTAPVSVFWVGLVCLCGSIVAECILYHSTSGYSTGYQTLDGVRLNDSSHFGGYYGRYGLTF